MKRYVMESTPGLRTKMVEDPNGAWVEHEDHVAALAAAEADAARYRWLRFRNDRSLGIDPPGPYCIWEDEDETVFPVGSELDAAIDAAREAKP